MAVKITSENFEQEVLASDVKVLVDFYADWCGPCQMLSPLVEEVAQEHPEYKVCKLNVDESMELAQEYKVVSIPMLVVFEKGEVVKKSLGLISKDEILALLQ
ncbi:MAG: thioredoxin [Roseburia sp.]